MVQRKGLRMVRNRMPDPPTADEGPKSPTDLNRRSWWRALWRAVVQADEDKITTWAGALTYYGILSIFPGLLVLISVLRLAGDEAMHSILNNITATAPGPTRTVLTATVTNLERGQQSTAGLLAIVGVLVALWSSSSYIGSFMDAANAIFDVPEGRPLWKRLPIRLAITIVAGVIVLAASVTVVVTGGLARSVGSLIGAESGTVAVWDVAKWPALVVVVGILFAILYWAAPNANHGGFRWVTPGSALATLMWVGASAGFAVLRGEVQLLQQDLRQPGGGHRVPGLALDQQPGAASRRRVRCGVAARAGRGGRASAPRRAVHAAAGHRWSDR